MAISLDCDNSTLILGGGVAGLAAACRLAELGERTLLLEAGALPSHKVCGEFLSPECLPWLERWNIFPAATIRRIGLGSREFTLPSAAGALSRYVLDAALADQARKLGAQVATETRVTGYRRVQDRFEVTLADGEILLAERILLGTGRLAGKRPALPYVGFKAHFADVEMGDLLTMHSFADAYMGICSIGDGCVNVACLARRGTSLPPLPEVLEQARNLFGWMRVEAPAFGRRELKQECDVYAIGDAAASIPPATGSGLAMGITSGVMAAEYAHRGEWTDYYPAWRHRFSSRLRWGRLLHMAMLSPRFASLTGTRFARLLYRSTRELSDRYPLAPPAPGSCPPSLQAADSS